MLDVLDESRAENNVGKWEDWKEVHIEHRLCVVMMSWSSN